MDAGLFVSKPHFNVQPQNYVIKSTRKSTVKEEKWSGGENKKKESQDPREKELMIL